MMIVVTGGAGFIGSNIIKGLNARGFYQILVVDDLTDGHKYNNLLDCKFVDFINKEAFLTMILHEDPVFKQIKTIFHQGACSDTTCWDGSKMLADNYDYSKAIMHASELFGIQLIYASSAAVYGLNKQFKEEAKYERPLNVYGYSKLMFDNYVRAKLTHAGQQIVGLRYFNVYGPNEAHKGHMASTAYHFYHQAQATGNVKLFGAHDGYAAGMQSRDFVFVEDVVAVNLWMMEHPNISGIFNVGSGTSRTFNDMATCVLDYTGKGRIEYIDFPEKLKQHYQSFTQADLSLLRAQGYEKPFTSLEQGVMSYCEILSANRLPIEG